MASTLGAKKQKLLSQMNVTIVLQAMILNLCQEHGSLRGLTARHFFDASVCHAVINHVDLT